MTWLEGKANEKEIGPAGKQPGKGQTWVAKYKTVDQILAEYGPPEPQPELAIDRNELAAMIAELEADQEPEF